MDYWDKSSATELAHREAALAAQRAKLAAGASAIACFDCGETIPDERRYAVPGVQRCVVCQEIFEKRQERRLA